MIFSAFALLFASLVEAARSDALFYSCVEEAVEGYGNKECLKDSESPPCLGLRKALEYSVKKETCSRSAGFCLEWQYGGLTESQWIAVAAGHLAKFGQCIRLRYSEEENPFAAAREDGELLTYLQQRNDGANIFGLGQGDLLLQTLEEKKFSAIIEASPKGKSPTPNFANILASADTPEPYSFQGPSEEPQTEEAPVLPTPKLVKVATRTKTLFVPAMPTAKKLSPPGRKIYSLGLDLTLFERVSALYRRKTPGLREMDEFIRTPPPPAKDLGELLRKGEAL